jgi:hypothetical protein
MVLYHDCGAQTDDWVSHEHNSVFERPFSLTFAALMHSSMLVMLKSRDYPELGSRS